MKLDIEEIKSLCTESSYERGVDYFRKGRVRDIIRSRNRITASVVGTQKYSVKLHTDREDFDVSCTCPYDWGGYCKHIVATLIAVSDDEPAVIKHKERKKRNVEDILLNLTSEEMKNFLRLELKKNKSLRDHFFIIFSGKGLKKRTLKDYKKEIKRLYLEVADRDGYVKYGVNVDFSYIYDLADWYLEAGNALESVFIYRSLSETIAENMDNVDDSDGYYGEEFTHAVEGFVESLIKTNLNYKDKKAYIDYFFDKYIENDPDYFRDHYSFALSRICGSKDELEYWKKLLEPYLPEDLPGKDNLYLHFMEKDLLMMQLYILDKLEENKEFYELIERYYRRDRELCLVYIRRLEKDKKIKDFVKVAEESLDFFPPHLTIEIRRFLNKYYEGHSPEKLKQNFLFLFIHEGKWEDYEKLKALNSREEWKKIFPEIIKALSKEGFRHEDLIINLFLKEGLFEVALEKVLQIRSLYTLKEFHKDLADRFPEEYFKAYKEMIIPFAESRTGRAHYREVIGYLKRMKRIKRFEKEFKELVDHLKTEYKNRPAFLDELRRV